MFKIRSHNKFDCNLSTCLGCSALHYDRRTSFKKTLFMDSGSNGYTRKKKNRLSNLDSSNNFSSVTYNLDSKKETLHILLSIANNISLTNLRKRTVIKFTTQAHARNEALNSCCQLTFYFPRATFIV